LLAQVIGKNAKCIKVICLPDPCSELELQIIDEYRIRGYVSCELSSRSIYSLEVLLKELTLSYYEKTESGGYFRKVIHANENEIYEFILKGNNKYNMLIKEKNKKDKALEKERQDLERKREDERRSCEEQRKIFEEIRREKWRISRISTSKKRIADPKSAFWVHSLSNYYNELGVEGFKLRIGQSVKICDSSTEESVSQKGYVRAFLPPEKLLNESLKQICIEDLRIRYENFPGDTNIFDETQKYLVEISLPTKGGQKSKSSWYAIPINDLPAIKGREHKINLSSLHVTAFSNLPSSVNIGLLLPEAASSVDERLVYLGDWIICPEDMSSIMLSLLKPTLHKADFLKSFSGKLFSSVAEGEDYFLSLLKDRLFCESIEAYLKNCHMEQEKILDEIKNEQSDFQPQKVKIDKDIKIPSLVTGELFSLNNVLKRLYSGCSNAREAVIICDFLACNLLGFEVGDENYVEILNWLILGHDTTVAYQGSESVYFALLKLVLRVEARNPSHSKYQGKRRLNILYAPGNHKLTSREILYFVWLDAYICLGCQLWEKDDFA